MIKENRMIMIGSTGRNSGKTTFGSEFIKKHKENHKIVALKVTTIEKRNMKCPRGGEGCGVCTSLKGNYDIREEKNPGDIKDTQRLKKAGAEKVYWIRAYPEYLSQAFEDFLSLLDDVDIILCESNSLRKYVKPGIFVMIDNAKDGKKTALDVIQYADYVFPQIDQDDALKIVNNLTIEV